MTPDEAARIAALEAELAAERARADAAEKDAASWQRIADAHIVSVRAFEKDAARYRWLRNDALQVLVSGPICVAADKWGKPLTQYPNRDAANGPAMPITLDGRALDAAIDAVNKQEAT